MRTVIFTALLALAAGAVQAQTAAPAPFIERTERVFLEGRRGPSLFRPGYAVGEYTGWASSRERSTQAPLHRSQISNSDFNIMSPSLGDVQASCRGGEAHTRLLWIEFQREDLAYVCSFSGSAPADARLSLALSRGAGVMARLQQPQRAGEMVWGGRTFRFETRQVGALPWAGGRTLGYVVTDETGVDLGGVAIGGLRPTFYLPPVGSADRDAVAVLTLSLFYFRDPANAM